MNEHNLISATGNSASNLEKIQNKRRTDKIKCLIPYGSAHVFQREKIYTEIHVERVKEQAQYLPLPSMKLGQYLLGFGFSPK